MPDTAISTASAAASDFKESEPVKVIRRFSFVTAARGALPLGGGDS